MSEKSLISPVFKVLLFEDYVHRAQTYRVNGADAQLRITSVVGDFLQALDRERWDVVLFGGSGFYNLVSEKEAVEALIRAYKIRRLRGVLFVSVLLNSFKRIADQLGDAGVPFRWYPYSHKTPSKHVQHALIERTYMLEN